MCQKSKKERCHRTCEEKLEIALRCLQTDDRNLVAKEFGVTPNQVTDYKSILMKEGASLYERRKFMRPLVSKHEQQRVISVLSSQAAALEKELHFYRDALEKGHLVIKYTKDEHIDESIQKAQK